MVNRPKPIAANATNTVFRVRICQSRPNAASTEIGAGCSSSMTSPSTSFFSNWPRGGSGAEEGREGEHRHRNAEEEERPAPAVVAAGQGGDPATITGLSVAVRRPAIPIDAPIRPRLPIG